jgi:hypothetical protein
VGPAIQRGVQRRRGFGGRRRGSASVNLKGRGIGRSLGRRRGFGSS